MTPQTALTFIEYSWVTLGLVWLAGLAFTKRTVRAQPTSQRIFHLAAILLGFLLLAGSHLRGGWLGSQFLSPIPAVEDIGVAITVAGCLFAIWARITLGSNWSGRATVKAKHELIVKGPYAIARHPIYTGILTGAVGTGLAVAEWRCFLGFALMALMFAAKIGQEEKLMMETFPAAYPQYRQRVKALIPGVL
jgi:protein-S-isoprenylcysteine O-methyltransferase Ste14